VHRAERDAGGVALVERADARRMIAAERIAHHRHAFGIDVGSLKGYKLIMKYKEQKEKTVTIKQ
jgi:hypothetical protein